MDVLNSTEELAKSQTESCDAEMVNFTYMCSK